MDDLMKFLSELAVMVGTPVALTGIAVCLALGLGVTFLYVLARAGTAPARNKEKDLRAKQAPEYPGHWGNLHDNVKNLNQAAKEQVEKIEYVPIKLTEAELSKSKPVTIFVIYIKKYIRLHELQIGHKHKAEMWLRTNLRTLEKRFKQDLGFAPIIKAPEGHELIPYLRHRLESI